MQWVVKRIDSWHNAHKKLVGWTEKQGRVIDFWIVFSNGAIVVRLLTQQA